MIYICNASKLQTAKKNIQCLTFFVMQVCLKLERSSRVASYATRPCCEIEIRSYLAMSFGLIFLFT
uniref:Uncharacterized protein n=1 Tax=Arundo donax TaxID=35708 RepID=A0A0A9FGC0_ARUDO